MLPTVVMGRNKPALYLHRGFEAVLEQRRPLTAGCGGSLTRPG